MLFMSIQETIQNYTNYLLSFIYQAKEQPQIKEKLAITTEQALAAAKYWGNFLPGVKDVYFSDINKHSKLDTSKTMQTISILNKIARQGTVTQDQYNSFVEILAKKILAKELDWDSVQLGHSSFYEPPEEVQEAIDEAGLKISAFGIMPFKTQMNIYPDGHIEVNYKTIDLTQNPTGCAETNSYKDLYATNLKQLSSAMNPHHSEIPDLSAKLAIHDLAAKCQDSQYDDTYSKVKLIEYDLYPWNLEDSAAAVEALCGLLQNYNEL